MIRDIQSATNPFVKHLRALLTSKKARQEDGAFVLEGQRGIQSLIDHDSDICSIRQLVISDDWDQPDMLDGFETVRLPRSMFDKLSDVRSAQGILAIVDYRPTPLFVPKTGNLLLLDNLRDPGNLGTLIRSAVGAGFRAVLLYGDCVEAVNPKVIRATMGTFAFTEIQPVGDEEIRQLTEAGYELCVTTGTEGENLYQAGFGNRTILAIGSEAHGISAGLMKLSDRRITIPLHPQCESLNAAVAGSICMFSIASRP